ncbi:hypothetical protein Murru_2710 [Allomuricauda ruestringensis DSM 13258]|uniref:Secreted protein n=1 Tax=Allomuricauda ruestringensis (strain DSM 13258 / CIP 107369 / LMG 19739 / B1) TaxID=886377 RepID=G2PIC3_ALLRU|nr:hypothetical protein [Allomuricauda ruestringensis]AEM71741.1 hypothetical protein Murru_2710 [Allomuricauda ruestringensis DSM 13258]
MKRSTSLFTLFYLSVSTLVIGQELSFAPDVVFGNRSLTYKHLIKYSINPKLSVDNLTLFDTEYGNDLNNLYFIRNTISYALTKNIRANTAIGIKNPGAFGTVSMSFSSRSPRFSFTYSAGSTYQDEFSFEQSIVAIYLPSFGKNHQGYINLLATANINANGYARGLQQLKIGIRKEQLATGFAINLDQFNKARKTLTNTGIFLKYNF